MHYQFSWPQTATSLRLALADDAFYQTMQKAANDDPVLLEAYLDYSMREAEQYGILEFASPADAGAAIWSIPLDEARAHEKSAAKSAFIEYHLGHQALQTYKAIVDNMDAQAQGIVEADDWYLSILGINPNTQGGGLGRKLLQRALSDADKAGKACFLETFTPKNMSFYAHLGFIAVHQAYEPTADKHYWIMRRLPKTPKS